MQIKFIYNDKTYWEMTKAMDLETYGNCLKSKIPITDYKVKTFYLQYNKFNKGLLSNFYNVIGPTLFHFILPLPKPKKQNLDFNTETFKYNSVPHSFDLVRHLKEVDDPTIKESLEQQMKAIDPNAFLQAAYEKYGNSVIE